MTLPLHRAVVGLGWDAEPFVNGFPVDLDVSVFLLNDKGVVRFSSDFVYYDNFETAAGAVRHVLGDNESGSWEGDDEFIGISLDNLPFDVKEVALCASIHEAQERKQHFGLVKDAYIRLANQDSGEELARASLVEQAAGKNGFIFGVLRCENRAWKFYPASKAVSGGLAEIAKTYGIYSPL